MRAGLFLSAFLAAITAVAETPECPADHVVEVDFDDWAKQIRIVKTQGALESSLTRIGLPGVNAPDPEFSEHIIPDEVHINATARVLVADVFRVALSDQGPSARVVQVLAATEFQDYELQDPEFVPSPQLQRAATFVPLEGKKWCRVDMPFLQKTGSAWGPQLCDPVLFSFEKLTSPKHSVLKVVNTDQWCGSSGSERGGDTELTYYELQGLQLRDIFRETTWDGHYNSFYTPTHSLKATVRAVGKGYPKQLDVVEKMECFEEGLEAAESAGNPRECKPYRKRTRYTYENGSY